MNFNDIYDISVTLGAESIDYPGDTPYLRECLATIDGGDSYELSRLEMSTHSGTHLDMPAHFIRDGKTLDDYDVGEFIMPAKVYEINDNQAIRPSELHHMQPCPGDAVLFKTKNSTKGLCRSGAFSKEFVHLSSEAAQWCVARKLALVGTDYITIEDYGDAHFSAHHTILGNGMLVLEGIDLLHVPPGEYTLVCLPLKIKGGEASPVRAILIR